MKVAGFIRVVLMIVASCVIHATLVPLLCSVRHTGPHDWYVMPGITLHHRYGNGVELSEIRPFALSLMMTGCYAISWLVLRVALGSGGNRFKPHPF